MERRDILPAPESVLGPIFISLMFHVAFVGMITGQTFVYFNKRKRDHAWLRVFIALLLMANLLNCGFNVAYLYGVLVKGYANVDGFLNTDWMFATNPALMAIIGATAQMFFVWRVLVLTREERSPQRWLVAVVILLCAIGQLLGGTATAIEVSKNPTFDDFKQIEGAVVLWLGCSALGTLGVVGVFLTHFIKHRVEFLGYGPVADRINSAFVQTGLILGGCTTAQLIVYLTTPSGHRLTVSLPLSQLYTATLLSALNTREGWGWPATRSRSASGCSVGDETGTMPLGFISNPAHGSHNTRQRETIVLHPISYEAHEMAALDKGPVVLERVPEAPAHWENMPDSAVEVKYAF